MDKQILAHKKFVQDKLAYIARLKDRATQRQEAQKLLKFHDAQIKNFQHERLVHLIITLFFAVLTLASWFGFCAVYLTFVDNIWILLGAGLLTLILTVLEICYVAYYYSLENHTQKLYGLSQEIYQLVE